MSWFRSFLTPILRVLYVTARTPQEKNYDGTKRTSRSAQDRLTGELRLLLGSSLQKKACIASQQQPEPRTSINSPTPHHLQRLGCSPVLLLRCWSWVKKENTKFQVFRSSRSSGQSGGGHQKDKTYRCSSEAGPDGYQAVTQFQPPIISSSFHIVDRAPPALNRPSPKPGECGTMRSGLQSPGVIPLLTLIVFALLSVLPTVSTAWESYNTRPKWLAYDTNEFPRALRDLVTSAPLLRMLTVDASPPCTEDGSIPDVDAGSQAFCMGDNIRCFSQDPVVYPSSKYHLSQVTVGESTDLRPFAAGETSKQDSVEEASDSLTVLLGTLRSLRMLVFQDTKESRLAQLLPGRNVLSDVFSGVANSSYLTVVQYPDDRASGDSWMIKPSSRGKRLASHLAFPLRLCETWQQVCHLGVSAWKNLDRSFLPSIFDAWIGSISNKGVSTYRESPEKNDPPESRQPEGPTVQVHSSTHNVTAGPRSKPSKTHLLDALTLTPPSSTTSTEQENVAAGASTNPKEMRGSCMAIVIGLVVGIMWF